VTCEFLLIHNTISIQFTKSPLLQKVWKEIATLETENVESPESALEKVKKDKDRAYFMIYDYYMANFKVCTTYRYILLFQSFNTLLQSTYIQITHREMFRFLNLASFFGISLIKNIIRN